MVWGPDRVRHSSVVVFDGSIVATGCGERARRWMVQTAGGVGLFDEPSRRGQEMLFENFGCADSDASVNAVA